MAGVAGLFVALCALLILLALLRLWRVVEVRQEEAQLEAFVRKAAAPPRFDPVMVEALPDPARRYFLHVIRPGTPLRTRARLMLRGEMSLRSGPGARYLPMRARQVLSADGFIWQARVGRRPLWIAGSDGYVGGASWTRFWFLGIVPLVRVSSRTDHARSAAGRCIAEAAFWAPAALLPGPGVTWSAAREDVARVSVERGGHVHDLEIEVAPDGRPQSVRLMRWSRENPQKTWRLQPFGGRIRSLREVGGFRIAEAIEGGNGFGGPDYFAFYRARVSEITFH